jgi:hypothetical protein
MDTVKVKGRKKDNPGDAKGKGSGKRKAHGKGKGKIRKSPKMKIKFQTQDKTCWGDRSRWITPTSVEGISRYCVVNYISDKD